MSHLEMIDVSKMPQYYFGLPYIPPMDMDQLGADEV
jgi:hypothetical protein